MLAIAGWAVQWREIWAAQEQADQAREQARRALYASHMMLAEKA